MICTLSVNIEWLHVEFPMVMDSLVLKVLCLSDCICLYESSYFLVMLWCL